MNKILLAITGACIVIAVFSPIAVFALFNDATKLEILAMQQENENLEEEIRSLENAPYSTKPYLVTKLGWYLHDSSDQIAESKRTFTIYGYVFNVGATNATNCKLIINFCDNITSLQTSELDLGDIAFWTYRSISRVIDCRLADSVTRIKITPKWS